MNNQNSILWHKGKLPTILLIIAFFLVVATIFTFVQKLKYSSSSRLLIVQNFSVGSDPYAISKANDFITNIFSEIIHSNSFYNDVLSSGFGIDKNYFINDNSIKKQMKIWNKTIAAFPVKEKGIIDIEVYHPDKAQAIQISEAINYVLKTKHQDYNGSGSNIDVKVIDNPIISDWPVKPNIALNYILALVFGVILSFSYVFIFPEEKYNLRLIPSFQKKVKLQNHNMAESYEEKYYSGEVKNDYTKTPNSAYAPEVALSEIINNDSEYRTEETFENTNFDESKFAQAIKTEDQDKDSLNDYESPLLENEEYAFNSKGDINNVFEQSKPDA